MKILHTADWHLGKRLEQFSRLEEQTTVLAEICDIADEQKVDAVIIAGDLFDTFNPATEAVELFYKTLKRLTNNGKRLVVAIAGNHDSPERIEAPDPLARECGIVFSGFPTTTIPLFQLESGLEVMKSVPGFIELKLPNTEIPLRLILTPYANEYRMKTFLGIEDSESELRQVLQEHWGNLASTYCDDRGVNLLVTHLFMVKNGGPIPEEPEEEKPISHVGGAQAIYTSNVPDQIQYVALGHLHRPFQMDAFPCPVVYSGSPLSYSFSEAEQQKFVNILQAEPGKPIQYEQISLNAGKRLIRHRAEGADEALQWLAQNPDTLVELTLVTESYLTAVERKAIMTAHDGIVAIIPEIRTKGSESTERVTINLNQEMDNLFKDYFQTKTGQPLNEELLALFQEIKAERP
jgi:exonuclease SbcD